MVTLSFTPHDGDEARRLAQDGRAEDGTSAEQRGGEAAALLQEPRGIDREHLLLFEAHPLPMWVYDSETLRFLDVNDAAIERYGYERDEFLALTLRDVRPACDVPLLLDAIDSISTEKRFSATWRHQDKNGRIFWVDVTSHAIQHQGRNARLAVAADITEQKRAQSHLHDVIRSARCILWHALVAQTPGGLNWNVQIFNESAARNFLSIDFHQAENQPRIGHLWALPEDVPDMVRISESAILAGDQSYQLEYRCLDANREIRWLSEDVRIEADGPGIWNLTGVITDITDRKQGELAAGELNQTLQSLIHASPIAVTAIDHNGVVSLWNPAAARIFGWSEGEVLNKRAPFLPQGRRGVGDSLSEIILQGQETMGYETTSVRKDASTINISISTAPLTNSEGTITSIMAMISDITNRKQLETERQILIEEAARRGDQDELTGLLNHRLFHNRLKEEMDWAAESGMPLAVFLLDLDNFTFFNDTYGHRVGDEVLRQVASALSGVAREEGLVALARFSGDEFVFLLPGGDEAHIAQVIQKTSAGLDHLEYRPPGHEFVIPLTLSLGISIFPQDGPGSLELLRAAGTRLTRSKLGVGSVEHSERVRNAMARSKGFTMLDSLVTAVDNKDGYTRRHSEDVMLYCDEIALEMGLDESVRHNLEVGALLHDVGKIGVSDYILRKPGRLTDEEFQSVMQHPMMGAMMIGTVAGFEDVLDVTQHHHERWDGGGYPFGLRGEETPLLARIMAVADAFSAMTTDRPYRKGMPSSKALELLEGGAGTQWDPVCVAHLVTARRRALIEFTL